MAEMEVALGWAAVTVSEVSGSRGVGCGEGGGGNGGGVVIVPSSWGMGCNGNRGGLVTVVAVFLSVGSWRRRRRTHRYCCWRIV